MFKKNNLLAIFAILFMFASSCTEEDSNNTVTDIDGNEYHTVTIGTQVWMVENLKTTRYNDGTNIPYVTDVSWANLSTPGYCYYGNDAANKYAYGALYNWYTVNTGKLAPKGWHVPSDEEWTTLINYLIANGYNFDGTTIDNKVGKSMAATSGWKSDSGWDPGAGSIGDDLSRNNKSGFAGFPGGCRYVAVESYTGNYIDGGYLDGGVCGYWWSSTSYSNNNFGYRYLAYESCDLHSYTIKMPHGFSVRCLRD